MNKNIHVRYFTDETVQMTKKPTQKSNPDDNHKNVT